MLPHPVNSLLVSRQFEQSSLHSQLVHVSRINTAVNVPLYQNTTLLLLKHAIPSSQMS